MIPVLAAALALSNNNVPVGLSDLAFPSFPFRQDTGGSSVEEQIRRASPITGVPERLKLEGVFRDPEERALVGDRTTYLLDKFPRLTLPNVVSIRASQDGRYLVFSQVERIGEEQIVSNAAPNYDLRLHILDRTKNPPTLVHIKLPQQSTQSEHDSPQAIEGEMLNDIAFFSGSSGSMLVVTVDRTGVSPQRVAWIAGSNGNCSKIGSIGWKDEISLSPFDTIGLLYAWKPDTQSTHRTTFSPSGILKTHILEGQVLPFGWTKSGQAIESEISSGQHTRWRTVNPKTLEPTLQVQKPIDITPTDFTFNNVPVSIKGDFIEIDSLPKSNAVSLGFNTTSGFVLPRLGKTPIHVLALSQDGTVRLLAVNEIPTEEFEKRLEIRKERILIEDQAKDIYDAIKELSANGNLPSPESLLASLSSQGLSLEGLKLLYNHQSNVESGIPIAELRGKHWVASLMIGKTPSIVRIPQ